MSRLTTQETGLEEHYSPTELQTVSRMIRAISGSTRPINALRATLRAVCGLCGAHSATLELSSGDDADPIQIATDHNLHAVSDDYEVISISYPLDVKHAAWRSACVVVMTRTDQVGDRLQTLAALLTMLGATLDHMYSIERSHSLCDDQRAQALDDHLSGINSIDELREIAVEWLGRKFGGDFALARTTIPSIDLSSAIQTRTSCWQDEKRSRHQCGDRPPGDPLLWPLSAGALLVADRTVDRGRVFQVAVGRTDEVLDWSDENTAQFDLTVSILARHVNRVTRKRHVAMQATYLNRMQELTSAASSASKLDELCEIVHEATLRFMPVDRFQVSLDVSDNGAEIVYDVLGPDTRDSPATPENLADGSMQSTLHAPLLSNGQTIGTILVESRLENAFRTEHADVLVSIAHSAAGAFERLVLLNLIASQSRYETGLRLVAERINGTLDIAELMQIASDVIFDAIACEFVAVSVMEPQSDQVLHRSFRSANAGFTAPAPGLQMREESLALDATRHMTRRAIRDRHESLLEVFSSSHRTDSGCTVTTHFPINQDLVGVIILGRTEQRSFAEDALSLQQQIAAMLSKALGNAFAYSDQLRHTRDLSELQHLASRIASQLDLERSLDEIVQSSMKLVEADGSTVAMIEDDALVIVESLGSVAGKVTERLPMDLAFVAAMLEETEHLAVSDFDAGQQDIAATFGSINYARALLAVRFVDPEGRPAGIIGVFSNEPRVWTERDISLLTTLSSASAIAIQNARHFEGTRNLLRASVESLATAVEAKDPGSQNHARLVARYARMIAEELDLTVDTVDEIELAALLHDVGKIGIPDSVLQKPGPLDSAEWAAVQLHPAIGEQILSGNPTLEALLPMVRHHHERWDGHGYPDRLKEQQIPVGAAIIAVAEALDSMTTHRPYQATKLWTDAASEIVAGCGSQFAQVAVDAFSRLNARGAFLDDEARVAHANASKPGWNQRRSPALDVRALRIMEAVATEIREGADLGTFLTNIMRYLRDLLDIPFLAIFTRREGDGTLQMIASDPVTPLSADMAEKVNAGQGIVNWVARHGVIQNIPDVTQDDRFVQGILGARIMSELCVPLIADGQVIGVLNLESDHSHAFSEADERLLMSTADHLANAIHVVQLHERLKVLSRTDALTGLDNHRAFFDRLVIETTKSMAENSELSIVIMDVNKLKDINDNFGHLVGDAALRGVADVLGRHRREDDAICRYGGDEFALILPGTSHARARAFMEDLSLELAHGEFEVEGMSMPLPTSSWGIATTPEDGSRPIELLETADGRMYIEKPGGHG